MSSPLVKNGNGRIMLTDDKVVLELKVMESGQASLHAPLIPPAQVCKILQGLITDLMFASIQAKEEPNLRSV